MTTPRLLLNDGSSVPAIGLGVYQSGARTIEAVSTALRLGYRLVDTAAAYGNERDVGIGIRESGVPRGDVVIETKVWVSDYGADETRRALEKAQRKLGVETVDLMLLHAPAPSRWRKTVDAWRALEWMREQGTVRSVGVSNFLPDHLRRLVEDTAVVPAINQIEVHPYFAQRAVQDAGNAFGIVTQAWSPIGGITFYPGWGEGRRSVLADRTIGELAARHGRTPAQIMLRWHVQQGRAAVPKSIDPGRIAENAAVHDFILSSVEIAAIDALETGVRGGWDPDADRPESFDRPVPVH